MKTKLILLFAISSLTFASCANGEKGSTVKSDAPQEENTKQNKQVDPCNIFTLDNLKKGFSINESVDVVTDQTGNFPTCGYTWNTGRKRPMTVNKMEIEVDVENRVMIVIVGKASKEMYEASIKVYPETTPVKLGEIGVWS